MKGPNPLRRRGLLGGRAATWSALTLGLFLLVTLLIGLRLADGIDLGAAGAADATLGPLVEPRFTAVALLWSPEFCLLYGLVAAAVLWWRGWGFRSAAPLAFLLLVPVEVVAKYTLHRQPMPIDLKPWPPYPWVNPGFGGDGGGYYLSGSALRTAFFCLLVAMVLWRRDGGVARLGSVVAATASLLFGLIRVYGGYHWLTAELSGQLLGAALALLVGSLLADPIRRQDRPDGTRRT